MIWNVKMTRQAKLTVTIILGLGVLYGFPSMCPPRQEASSNIGNSASIATLIRLKFLAELNNVDDILCTYPTEILSAFGNSN